MGVCVSSTAPSSSQKQQQHHQLEGNGEEQSRKKHTLSSSRRTSGSYNNGGGAVVSLQHTNSSSSHQNTECFSSSCHLSGGAPDNDSSNNNNNTGNTHHRQGNSKESLRCVTHPEDDADDDDDDKGGVGVGVRTTAFLQGTPAHAHTHTTDKHHQCSSKSHNVFPQDRVDPPITMTAVDGSLLVAEYSLRGGGGRGVGVGESDREVSQAHHLAVSDKKIPSEESSSGARPKDKPPSSTLQSRSGGCTGDGGCTSRRQRRAINPAAFKSIQDPHQTNAATGSVAGAGASSSSWPAHPLHQFQRAVTPVRDSMPSTVPAEAVVAPAAAHHFCEDAFGSPRPSVQFTEESTIPGGGGGGQRDVLPFLLPPQQLVLPPAQGGACSTLDEGHSEERHVTVKTSHDEDCEGFIYPASPEAATPSPRQFRGVNNPLASPSAVVAGVTRTMIVATASGERRQRGGGVAFFHEEASLSTSAHRDMVVGAGGSTSGSAYPYCAYGGGGATTALLFAPLSSIPSANSEHFESFVSAPMLRSPATSSHAANRPRGW